MVRGARPQIANVPGQHDALQAAHVQNRRRCTPAVASSASIKNCGSSGPSAARHTCGERDVGVAGRLGQAVHQPRLGDQRLQAADGCRSRTAAGCPRSACARSRPSPARCPRTGAARSRSSRPRRHRSRRARNRWRSRACPPRPGPRRGSLESAAPAREHLVKRRDQVGALAPVQVGAEQDLAVRFVDQARARSPSRPRAYESTAPRRADAAAAARSLRCSAS